MFKWKIHHYAPSVIKKKRHCCISLVNVPMWFTFGNSSQLFFENNLILPALTPQTALLGLLSLNANHNEPIINHFLLIFKLYVYNSREKHRLNMMDLLTDIKEMKKTEYRLPSSSGKKRKIYQKKWCLTHEKLPIEKN